MAGQWNDLPSVQNASSPAFPLPFTASEFEDMMDDAGAADAGLDAIHTVQECLNDYWPDIGCGPHEHYEKAKAILREIKREIVQALELSDEEKQLFDETWPFDE